MNKPAVAKYVKERDEVLLSGDLRRFRAWAIIQGYTFQDDQQAELTRVKMVTAIKYFPEEVRKNAKRWLRERGYHSLDDGDIP